MQKTYNTLLNNYSKTEEGKAIFQEINVEKGTRLNEIIDYAVENYIDDPVEFMKYMQNEHEKMTFELYMGPDSKLYKFNYNSGIAVESYFSKSIMDREIEMNLEERYGFLSNWKFGTAIIKGFDVTLPKEIAHYKTALSQNNKNKDLQAVENLFKWWCERCIQKTNRRLYTIKGQLEKYAGFWENNGCAKTYKP